MPQYDKADIERRMNGAVESLKGDLSGLRTGRANTTLLDPVVVEVYGSNMPLNQVATVSASPAPRTVVVLTVLGSGGALSVGAGSFGGQISEAGSLTKTGSGTVTSSSGSINCGTTCSAASQPSRPT